MVAVGSTLSISAAAIWPYWMPEAVMNASAPTVTGCTLDEPRISAKTKLFHAKMNASRPAAAMPGPAERNRDLDKAAQPTVAVEPVGMLDVGADVLEIAAHDPQDQWQRDQLVDPDQADVGFIQADLLKVQLQRQQHQNRRRETKAQQRERTVLAEPELEARKRIGRRHAQQQRQRNRRARQQH